MSDNAMSGSVQPRVFLVVVDESQEYRVAVHYAARRAAHTGGRLALLYVIEPAEMQQFLAIEELAQAERREAAEELLQSLCEELSPVAGSMPIVYIREGRRRDELMALIDEEPRYLDPGARRRNRRGRARAAGHLFHGQARGAAAHPDHDRSRRPDTR